MAEIPLTRGMVAIVDEEDFDYLNQWSWCASREDNGGEGAENKIYYAVRGWREGKKQHQITMHQQLAKFWGWQLKGREEIDHEDTDGLNNRRPNLRRCLHRQNIQNRRKQRTYKGVNTSSKYKGVSRNKRREKWEAYICLPYQKGRKRCLGLFEDEEQAALAYNEAATNYFGEFARLNILRGYDGT